VVVTGGAGFIGSHLVRRLVELGHEVTVFDRSPAPPGTGSAVARYVQGDICDVGQLASVISPDVDVVYHLAALVGVDLYLARPLEVIDSAMSGTRNVLDLASRADARVVLASTSEVFGKNPAVPWREDSDRVLGPTSADRWAYSTAKALGEHVAFAFGRSHGLAVTVVRYFNVYGPGQRPAFVISRSVHRALNGRPPVVYDQGRQTRCFTFVDDAVAGTLLAAQSPAAAGQAFNIGDTRETTVRAVIGLIAKLTGYRGAAAPVETASRLGAGYEDLPRRVPDTAKARSVLGWDCVTALADGLAMTVAWARANPWWLALPDSGG
jgi:UDP-glucose 4-epimerase